MGVIVQHEVLPAVPALVAQPVLTRPVGTRREQTVQHGGEHGSLNQRGERAVLEQVLDRTLPESLEHGGRPDPLRAELEDQMVRSHIHHKGHRNKPLSKRQQAVNKRRPGVRARVEHAFGHHENSMGGTLVGTIGIARAKTKIGLKNLAYNMQRYVDLRRTGQRC
jgi:IS5 family transposase